MASLSGDSQDDRDSSMSDDEWSGLKSLVLNRITDVHSAGSFATFGCCETLVLPGIAVDEVGPIQLPLSSHDAQSLIRASRQAPFGKGNQTLVDETVRKTWEIDGSKVSLSNKAWHGWLEGIVRKVAEDLGVAGGPNSVRAELYKMLLYEKGAMFKPHKDTEKTSGMFGTLVICLPSEHVGGSVRLTHGQEEKTFDTAELSGFNMTYTAWYADVTHEIGPVQSGYRWVLTYNLVNTSSGFPQSAAGLNAQVARFSQTLTKWHGIDEGPAFFCYVLDYQYTEAGLKLTNLKGNDYYRTRYVADACSKSGDFCVLLASMLKVVTFPNDEGGEEDVDSELRVGRIVDLEGFLLGKSLTIPESFLLQGWLYDSRNPDNQSGGEYLGNQHAEINQSYSNTGMFIVSKASVSDFLLGTGHNLGHFIGYLQRLQECFQTKNNDPQIREFIVQTCKDHLTKAYAEVRIKDLFLGPIASAAAFIADQGLFRNAVRSVTNGFEKNTFFNLGKLICLEAPVVPENDLIEAFSRIPKLYIFHRSLQAFHNGFSHRKVNHSDEHQMQYLKTWSGDRMSEALKSLSEVCPQDAGALIEIVKQYDDKMFEESIKPFITRFVRNPNFSNAMAIEILSFSQSSSPDMNLVERLFPLVLDAAASLFELQKYSSAAKKSSSRDDYPYSSWPNCYYEVEKGRCDASIIVGLHKRLLQSDREKAGKLLEKIQSQTESLPYDELGRLVIPLLKQMIYIVDLCPLNARQFYNVMITTYITRVVQKEPEKPSDWARPDEKRKCYDSECTSCPGLQEFLMDPKEKSRRFVLHKDHWHLNYISGDYCETSLDESQKPATLTVTKTLKAWEANHSKWQKRASDAQETFRQLPQEELKQCLAEDYNALMDLRMVKIKDEDFVVNQTTDTPQKSMVGNPSDESSRSMIPQKRSCSDS